MPKLDYEHIAQLAGIVEETRQHPKLKAITEAAMKELEDIAESINPNAKPAPAPQPKAIPTKTITERRL